MSKLNIQRRQLSEFLKSCRGRLSPPDVGLPERERRRTPGLRREDVAALAGVSVTWYTWLEQGREIRVSAQLLEQIAATLRMSQDEREYLFALVQHRPAPPVAAPNPAMTPTLQRMLDALAVPAIVMTERWDVIGWNRLKASIIRDYDRIDPQRRNLLRILLVEELDRLDEAQFDEMTKRVVSKFRIDYSQSADRPRFNELIAELNDASPVFRRLWSTPDVTTKSHGVHVLHHAHLGGITFEHSSYVPEGSPTLRVVLYVPYDEASAEKVRQAWRDLH